MLEGKELEGKIGDVGSYSVDVDASLNCVVTVSISKEIDGLVLTSANSLTLDVATLLRQAEGKINSPLFTGALETILTVLGRGK